MQAGRFDIRGHDGEPLPHTFIRQEESEHLVLLFPGGAYGPDRPLLYYPSLLLTEAGADLLRLERLYSELPGFGSLSEGERARMIVTDALAAVDVIMAQRSYTRITLIGKSIGTLVAARLLKLEARLAAADCIWLTPLCDNPRWAAMVTERAPRSLFVCGTADRFYDPVVLDAVRAATGGETVIVDDANHSLEIPGDIARTIDAHRRVVEAIGFFVEGKKKGEGREKEGREEERRG